MVPGDDITSQRWDDEYANGRYLHDSGIEFVEVITDTLGGVPDVSDKTGLYVGCGNGRNYIPLADSGLNIFGIDVSRVAIRQLSERRPDLSGMLRCVDFMDFEEGPFDYLVSIQAFQHGTGGRAREYFRRSSEVLRKGGLLFLRVNSSSTQIRFGHVVCERGRDGGMTVVYTEGPKKDMAIHFYSRPELDGLLCGDFEFVIPPYERTVERDGPGAGTWSQWEAVLRKTARPGPRQKNARVPP